MLSAARTICPLTLRDQRPRRCIRMVPPLKVKEMFDWLGLPQIQAQLAKLLGEVIIGFMAIVEHTAKLPCLNYLCNHPSVPLHNPL
jgi:hypothetical protein